MNTRRPIPSFKHVHTYADGAKHFVSDTTSLDSESAYALLEHLLSDQDADELVGALPGQLVEFVLVPIADPFLDDTPQDLHAVVMDPVEVDDEVSVDDYIECIFDERERIWGPEGFNGDYTEYRWLIDNYGVTEIQDVRWQLFSFEEAVDELDPEDEDDAELLAFLSDEGAVRRFLATLLARYKSNNAVYQRDMDE